MDLKLVREKLVVLLNASIPEVDLEPLDLKYHRGVGDGITRRLQWSATYGSEQDMITLRSYDTMRDCVKRGVTVAHINTRTIEVAANPKRTKDNATTQ